MRQLTESRLFIARKTARTAVFFLLADLAKAYTAASPHGSYLDIVHLKPVASFAASPFWNRFWYAWVHIVLTYWNIEFANSAYGVLAVATGLANPRDCPSAFGDLKKLYSVRNAWS